jgi:2-deoxy-scyllo-inosamine dehydrogenase (SAM-dependent)/8-amino-3,8-dideoxy-alpha-D-manno-octulosonate transaminase
MVEIEINTGCNRRCSYCPNSVARRNEEGEMAPELFRHLLEQLRSMSFGGRVSYHFYGEPLLCSHLDSFVALTRLYLPRARPVLYSNGDLLDSDRLRSLADAGVALFVVTFHEGPAHQFQTVFRDLEPALREKVVYLDHQDLVLSNRGGILKDRVEGRLAPNTPCLVPSGLIVVTVLGTVLPCFDDYHQLHAMGNIRERHVLDIWNSADFQEFRMQLRRGNRTWSRLCRDCNNASVLTDVPYDYVP